MNTSSVSNTLVSVLMSCCHVESYLVQAIDSLLRQAELSPKPAIALAMGVVGDGKVEIVKC